MTSEYIQLAKEHSRALGPQPAPASHNCPGHEERMLAHSRRVHKEMKNDRSWTRRQEELYHKEMRGRVREVMEILGGWYYSNHVKSEAV